jgi:hypothetical protein
MANEMNEQERKMTRQEEFKQRLFALLREYNVTMSVEDDQIDFFSYTEWDENGNVVWESINFQTRWENGKE